MAKQTTHYTGRLAPSPTGHLHLGHARTFWIAAERARAAGGTLRLRMDDLDRERSRPEFAAAARKDLAWLGLAWTPPEVVQSERLALYLAALARLHAAGAIFPCRHSRRDVIAAAGAPHEDDDEPVYPPAFRPAPDAPLPPIEDSLDVNWRFRVPDGAEIMFHDGALGPQTAVAGREFGDFLVWRKDGLPSYQLACVVDDIAMGITEVVRGADLVRSTFRQLLLFTALGHAAPDFFHCPLVRDESGRRLAKRHDSLSLRKLRQNGAKPAEIVADFARESGRDG